MDYYNVVSRTSGHQPGYLPILELPDKNFKIDNRLDLESGVPSLFLCMLVSGGFLLLF